MPLRPVLFDHPMINECSQKCFKLADLNIEPIILVRNVFDLFEILPQSVMITHRENVFIMGQGFSTVFKDEFLFLTDELQCCFRFAQ